MDGISFNSIRLVFGRMITTRGLSSSTALITGGSSGIGLEIARALSAKGCKVILVARDIEKLKKAASTIDGVIGKYSVDISDVQKVQDLEKKVLSEHGAPNIIINSAGVVYPGKLEHLDISLIDDMIDIDLKGTIYICRYFAGSIKPPGHIVNISSMAGVIGLFGYTGYSAAKFGVWGFSEALRMEMNQKGIGVSVVFPPDTDTPQLEFENRQKPDELRNISSTISPIHPEMVARAVVKGIVEDRFMVFPDMTSKAAYHTNRIAGPAFRAWMNRKARSGPSDEQ